MRDNESNKVPRLMALIMCLYPYVEIPYTIRINGRSVRTAALIDTRYNISIGLGSELTDCCNRRNHPLLPAFALIQSLQFRIQTCVQCCKLSHFVTVGNEDDLSVNYCDC